MMTWKFTTKKKGNRARPKVEISYVRRYMYRKYEDNEANQVAVKFNSNEDAQLATEGSYSNLHAVNCNTSRHNENAKHHIRAMNICNWSHG